MVDEEIQIMKLRDMNAVEFKQLLEQTKQFNSIEINGISVYSTTESLDKVKQTACKLLNKYQDFLLLKKKQKIMLGND